MKNDHSLQDIQCLSRAYSVLSTAMGPPLENLVGERRYRTIIVTILSNAVVLNQGQFYTPGDTGQCQETSLVGTTEPSATGV